MKSIASMMPSCVAKTRRTTENEKLQHICALFDVIISGVIYDTQTYLIKEIAFALGAISTNTKQKALNAPLETHHSRQGVAVVHRKFSSKLKNQKRNIVKLGIVALPCARFSEYRALCRNFFAVRVPEGVEMRPKIESHSQKSEEFGIQNIVRE